MALLRTHGGHSRTTTPTSRALPRAFLLNMARNEDRQIFEVPARHFGLVLLILTLEIMVVVVK